jgi:predicted ATPase
MAPRDDLAALLGSLEARDLVQREAVSRIKGDQQYAFKHGLIHEVAYGTLPRAGRRSRHAAAARFLEAATSAGQSHEALGHHWREAGEYERALEHLVSAAELAGRGWAKGRAVELYGEAFELVPEEDAERRRSIRMRQVVLSQALIHSVQRDVQRPPRAEDDR